MLASVFYVSLHLITLPVLTWLEGIEFLGADYKTGLVIAIAIIFAIDISITGAMIWLLVEIGRRRRQQNASTSDQEDQIINEKVENTTNSDMPPSYSQVATVASNSLENPPPTYQSVFPKKPNNLSTGFSLFIHDLTQINFLV